MRTLDQLQQRLAGYGAAKFIHANGKGLIAWHTSTGDNLEVLFIEVAEPGKGTGLWLYRLMVDRILEEGSKPYHSVFAYRLGSNQMAARFYEKLGWQQVNLGRSIYRDDDTVLVWTTWDQLVQNLGMDGKGVK